MRFRENRPGDLARAREAVAFWREQHPEGTAGQMLAAIGHLFHPGYGPVLRGVLSAAGSHGAKITTGVRIEEIR